LKFIFRLFANVKKEIKQKKTEKHQKVKYILSTLSEEKSDFVGQMNPTTTVSDDLNVPTLMSKSPPSSPTENDMSVNDFDLNNQMNNFSLTENSLNENHSDRAELNQVVPPTELEIPAQNNEPSTSQIEFNWNPFQSGNEIANDQPVEEGNWADFGQVGFANASNIFELNPTDQVMQNPQEAVDAQFKINRTELKVDEKEEESKEEEEDEWADFVETTTPQTNIQVVNHANTVPIHHQAIKSEEVEQPIDQVEIESKQKEYETNRNQFDLFNLIENLFDQNLNTKFFNANESLSSNSLQEMLIDENSIWRQLQTFTSITDESISLKFKWNTSSIEEHYLKALSLEKIIPNQVSRLFSVLFLLYL
jgi:hypothetical protein